MSEGLVPSAQPDPVGRPQDWDKAVAAAYFRALGASQEAAAEAAGVSERTLWAWERSSWWQEAHRQAVEKWRTNLTAASRASLLNAIRGGDADLALKALERLDPAMSAKELTIGRVRELLGETIRIIREELEDDAAARVLSRVREVWR